jgi:hypothetical protein
MVALARAAQRQAGPRYAAGAQSNRVTDGNTPHATARSVEVNAGGVQHNLTRLSHGGDLAPNRAASATFPAQGVVARSASRFFNHLRMLTATTG